MIDRIVAGLLRGAPSPFRREQGEELLAVHRERSRSVTGWRRVWFAAREIVGIAGALASFLYGV